MLKKRYPIYLMLLLTLGLSLMLVMGQVAAQDDDPESTPEATATVTPEATMEVTPEATPEATDEPDDDNEPIIIVIEGPVQAININIITIYNINIELREDDPNLTIIQIGDIIHIEGTPQGDLSSGNFTIIAITFIFINVDINIDTGEVWRDDNHSCSNGPPSWAPAHGWRRRCGDINITINVNPPGNSGGEGMGMGMGDDD